MNIIQKIQLFLKVRKEVNIIKKEVKNMKDGWKTTEFWLTIFSAIVSIYFALSGIIPNDLAIKITAVCVSIYTVARAVVKVTPTTKDDELLDKLVEIVNSKKK